MKTGIHWLISSCIPAFLHSSSRLNRTTRKLTMLSHQLRNRLYQRLRQEGPEDHVGRFSPPETNRWIGDRLELAVGHEYANEAGRHWLIEKPLEHIWPASTDYLARWQMETAAMNPDNTDLLALKQELQQTIFLDLETCGFAGSMIFLVGLLYEGPGGPVLSQLWARNYSEEPAVLTTLRQILVGKKILATFNGKSFDWPQVRDRCTVHTRTARLPELTHVDLLHHARRRFKAELPNCRLQTLERYICGRRRVGDIPGGQIPDEYHRYVQSGDNRSVRSILHHNALDLVTLMQLSLVLVKAAGMRQQ